MKATSMLKKGLDKYAILVIEDNLGDFTLIEEFLTEDIKNLNLVRASTFKAAKDILSDKNNLPDVILLDLSLPDKSGSELINDIVAISANIPIIILTGYGDSEFGVKSLSMGVSDYIMKDELTQQLLHKSILYSIERQKLNLHMLNYIKTIEEQNQKLMDIAWVQSHLVRAPLARILGLIDIFNNHKNTFSDRRMILGYIENSAKELDKIIHNIVEKIYADLPDDAFHGKEPELQNM